MARTSKWRDRIPITREIQDITSRDGLYNSLGAFAIIMLIFLVMVNQSQKQTTEASTPPPGNIIVEAYWNQIDPKTGDVVDTDVDLWVQCGEDTPIGYSNKGGPKCNYLRDDLGNQTSDDPINYEMTASRGLAPGKYCVNTHLYSNRSGVLPIKVKVTLKISKNTPGGGATNGSDKSAGQPIIVADRELTEVGQELNMFCFFLNEKGEVTDDKGQKNKGFHSDAVCLRSPVNHNTNACFGTDPSGIRENSGWNLGG